MKTDELVKNQEIQTGIQLLKELGVNAAKVMVTNKRDLRSLGEADAIACTINVHPNIGKQIKEGDIILIILLDNHH